MSTKAKWIITLYAQDSDIQNLAYAVQSTGREAEIVKLSYMFEEVLDKPSDECACIVVTGSTTITSNLGRVRPKWVPGSWHNREHFKCSNYYAHWGKYLSQKRYTFLPLGEVIRQKENLFHHFGIDDQFFIRPDYGEKSFTGEIVAKERFDAWKGLMIDTYNLPLNLLCVVSSPIKIKKELRLFARRGKVIAGSTYRINGMVEQESLDKQEDKQQIIEFAEKVMGDNSPELPPVYVFDVAVEQDGNMSLMEIGCSNCAGFYDCDLVSIVTAISEEAEAEFKDYFS